MLPGEPTAALIQVGRAAQNGRRPAMMTHGDHPERPAPIKKVADHDDLFTNTRAKSPQDEYGNRPPVRVERRGNHRNAHVKEHERQDTRRFLGCRLARRGRNRRQSRVAFSTTKSHPTTRCRSHRGAAECHATRATPPVRRRARPERTPSN